MSSRTSIVDRWRRLDHAQRFAVTALVSVLACAVFFGWLLKSTVQRAVRENDERQTSTFVRHVISTEFGTSLFKRREPLADTELGNRIMAALALDEVFRLKVYNLEGRIIWSDEPELLGIRFPDNQFLDLSLAGEVTSVIEEPERTEHVFERGMFERIMETYIPIREDGSVVGVVEIYRHPQTLMRQLRLATILVWGASLGGGVLLYLAMVGVVGRINRTQRGLERNLRRLADDLSAEKSKLERIVNAVGAGLILADETGTIQWANDTAESWFGAGGSLVGSNAVRQFCQEHPPCESCPFVSDRPSLTAALVCEHALVAGDGGARTFQIITTPEPPGSADGRPIHYLQLILDVTESREVEAQLRQADKMALSGQLAAGIAHQINNPVGILMTTITHQLESKRPAGEGEERGVSDLEMMARQCRRIDQSVRSLLSFSRKPEGVLVPVDLRAVLEEAILLARPRMEHGGVELATDFDDRPSITRGDPNEILQLILNLINNAIDAMPEGGDLSIAAARTQDGGGPALLLTVSDSGTGLPAGAPAQVFEPFFTTKEIGRGTGLGLAMSKRAVESLGGSIQAADGDEGGAVFTVTIPLDDGLDSA
ncbi:MAG: ATP-binding protein [Thermoanaerobaculia bacterium]